MKGGSIKYIQTDYMFLAYDKIHLVRKFVFEEEMLKNIWAIEIKYVLNNKKRVVLNTYSTEEKAQLSFNSIKRQINEFDDKSYEI